MIRYFIQALRARWRGSRSLDLLAIVGVALGVASVLSIQILNRNALGAFQGSVRALSGQADLTVLGELADLPEAVMPQVLATPGVAAAWPLVRSDVMVSGRGDLRLSLVGFDLFAPVHLPFEKLATDLSGALVQPGWVAITPQLARAEGWATGDVIEVNWGDQTRRLLVGALIDFQRLHPLASSKLALMDIAQAQHLLGLQGRLQQIDVQAAAGEDRDALAMRLAKRLGPGIRVLSPRQREQEAARFLGPFRLNLTALSLISLLVGLFLVHQSVQASLVRRRQELGLLRSLGATRGQVMRLILGDVALLGLLGVAVGLPLGYGAAVAGLDGVSRTVSNLYLLEEMEALVLPPWLWALAVLVGVGGALVGALRPAFEISRRDPWSLLAAFSIHQRARSLAPRMFLGGCALLAAVAAWYGLWGRGWRPAGFVLAVFLALAIPLVTPLVVQVTARLSRARNFGLAYSLRSLGQRLQMTSMAVAALAVAVTMLVGVTLMVASFRVTIDDWIAATVRADIYVVGKSWRRGDAVSSLSPERVAELTAWPGVRAVDPLRRLEIVADGLRLSVAGVDMALPGGEERFAMLAGDATEAQRLARENGAILLGEPVARQLGLRLGDTVRLPGPDGPLDLPLSGIFYDYSAGAGAAAMDLEVMERLYGAGPVHNLALYLEPGLDADEMVDALEAAFAGVPLNFRSHRRLRREVLAIFDQTFAVTRILQAMGLLIAATGIMLTLLVLARQQVSELALYRALGARRGQIFRVYVGKGLAMAVLGLGLGLAAGLVLAFILTFVINRDYFGWTMQFHWQWSVILGQALTILVAAVLASIYPAVRASRTPAAELSREEVA